MRWSEMPLAKSHFCGIKCIPGRKNSFIPQKIKEQEEKSLGFFNYNFFDFEEKETAIANR